MDIFENVERQIGPFNTWPSYILQYLFCEPLNSHRLKILSAFFYGNGVSLLRTLDLFKACAPNFNSADRFVITNLFTCWNKSQTSRDNIRFYNLILNNISNLNGDKINTVSQTDTPIAVLWKKGFDGLQEDHINTVTNVFRTWYASQ